MYSLNAPWKLMQKLETVNCSERERVSADEDAGDVHGLPFQGGAASRILTLQLLRLQW
jgi:hypothetical protein